MELDFSREWHIIGAADAEAEGPAAFAAAELSAVIGRMGCRSPAPGDEGCAERIIVLSAGTEANDRGRRRDRFSWRASDDRVEMYGESGPALLRAAYDFLGALGARWAEPGAEGERLPRGPVLSLATSSRASDDSAIAAAIVLGHGAFLERYAEYLPWAARTGYSSVFVHTTHERLAMRAAPAALYESLRGGIIPLAKRLGLSLELGGPCIDLRLCAADIENLSLAAEAFAASAAAHPEIAVFHAWPDDSLEGDSCSCPTCASLSPAARSLRVARALAAALGRVRPDAALSFLARDCAEELADEIRGSSPLPIGLELLWAARQRSWSSGLDDSDSPLNAAAIAAFRKAARAWRAGGGGRVAALGYYEDAFLFKGAVPPLAAVMEGDLAAYRSGDSDERVEAIGLLCAGGRLPLAPRPNAALLPALAASPTRRADETLADWAAAAYRVDGGSLAQAVPMLDYWREVEAAWAIDLDIEEGETEVHRSESSSRGAADPPADWGDPWKAGEPRLAIKRGRCEELFDHLRRAEAALAEAAPSAGGEAAEYAVSGSILELNCARLSTYHELAAGDRRAAADIANLALSASGAVRKSFAGLRDSRSRREMRLMIELYYNLRLKSIRRANARSALRRLVDLWYTALRATLGKRRVSGAYEPPASLKRLGGLVREGSRH
jgi:hypothetical protein